jgi:hypothetical protein
MLHRVNLAWVGFKLTTLVVIGTNCTDRCKSNYPYFALKNPRNKKIVGAQLHIICESLTPLSTIFQLYHGGQFY